MKRHLKTHGRKKHVASKATSQVVSGSSDLIITKIEESHNSGGMSDESNDDNKGEIEASVSQLQFDNDPLDTSRTL